MRKFWRNNHDSPLLISPISSTHDQCSTSIGSGANRKWLLYEKRLTKGSIQSMPPNKNSSDRTASVYSSILNILATILGSGLLSLPYAMAGCGVWIGVFVFALIMVLSTISYVNLSKAVRVYPGDCDFMMLAKDSLPTQFNWIVDFLVFINGTGCGIAFLVIMSTLMPEVIESFFPKVEELVIRRQLWCVVLAGVALPLVLSKKLETLKFTSFLVVIFVLYSLVAMIYYYVDPPLYAQTLVVHYEFPGDVVQFLTVFAIIAKAFSCSQNVPHIVNTIMNPTEKRLKIVFVTSTTLCLVVYIGVAYIGYTTFGEDVDSNVLRSYPPGLPLISIARLSITLALAGSYPVQLHPARNSLSVLVYGVSAEKLPPHQYFPMTIGIWSATVVIAMITDNLGVVSTFFGALATIPLTFIYPNLFWIRISQKLGSDQTVWHAWFILILGVIFVPISLSTEIYKLFTEKE